jgi:hypothetical protein
MNNLMKISHLLSRVRYVIAIFTLLALPHALHAQGCAMCYQNAAASGPRSIRALKTGIIVLMVPPALITLGFFHLAYKKRDSYNETE